MTSEQIRTLLNEMSLQEKIGQLLQLTGNFYAQEGLATGPMSDMELTQEQVDQAGSILSTVGARQLRRIQKEYMEKQPHHIPLLFMADVINGLRTVFPIPLAQGCSFDPELSQEMARISAKESARAGLHVTFSPMVDLVRDARWGRVMESTGEDPYLNGLFGQAMIRGYQGESVGEQDRIAACVKHFAGYGAPLGGREYNQVELSERTLWEEYLPAYRKGVEAGAELFMTSFNTLGRVPSTANRELMQDVLREKWGFDGVLISDWAAIQELLPHTVAEDKEEAAALALQAGVDIDMMTNVYANHLQRQIREGKLPMEWLDASVLRILNLKNRLGLFEKPYKDADEAYDETEHIEEAHRAFARKAAPETFVLLRNDGILPLPTAPTQQVRNIAFIGPYVEEKRICGSWSLFYRMEENVTIGEALREAQEAGKLTLPISLASGCQVLDYGQERDGFRDHVKNESTKEELEAMEAEALRIAREADAVVMPIGEHHEFTGEGAARTQIGIPEHQLELFRKVYAVNPNIVAVTFSGRPLDLREVSSKARAVLHVWFPGTEGGHAIVDTLFGEVEPGGRLSMSFPYNVGQVPVYYSELNTGRPHVDGRAGRCVSRYIDAPNKPLYRFGYGLGYTSFAYSQLTLSSDELIMKRGEGDMESGAGELTATVTLTNTGSRQGTEVVQLYIRDLEGSVARPVRELKGFQRVTLAPGESRRISFAITIEQLCFYRLDMSYGAEPGRFRVFVGGNSDTDNGADFVLRQAAADETEAHR
ncbi:MAG: beta-glucosidase BglX [bacterium]|nr:beta-glucosidase BglX [bacterium]MCM1376531.1 beta-glucosidase BglX [Muribaculum sp.]